MIPFLCFFEKIGTCLLHVALASLVFFTTKDYLLMRYPSAVPAGNISHAFLE